MCGCQYCLLPLICFDLKVYFKVDMNVDQFFIIYKNIEFTIIILKFIKISNTLNSEDI